MKTIPVFFTPKQAAKNATAFSPSAGKPAIVAQALLDRGFAVSIKAPRPLLFSEMERVHGTRHLMGILDGTISNGFGNKDLEVARSLPYTTGSMLSAALAATPEMPAVSLSSGFHHAGYTHTSGFCTLNGLMIAAAALLSQKKARRVAILDADAHYGNGTDEILRRFPKLAVGIIHRTVGQGSVYHAAYLQKVARFLEEILAFNPDVVIYQAGADPHECDPLGGYISTEEMRQRDRMVFEWAKKNRIALCWNLAGGYNKGGVTGIDPVLALHLNTFREACAVYGLPVPAEMVVAALTPSVNAHGNDRRWWEDEEWNSEGGRYGKRETMRRSQRVSSHAGWSGSMVSEELNKPHRLSERTMFDLDRF
jgi:acetoin utilization deacetylase AcuC-like enzyme